MGADWEVFGGVDTVGGATTLALPSATMRARICEAMERMCQRAEFFARSDAVPTCFVSRFRPSYPLWQYLEHVMSHARCSEAAWVLALVYLDRVGGGRRSMALSYSNVHRLFLAALVVAIKYIDDDLYRMGYYAHVGGLADTSELNCLEQRLLELLGFNLYVHPDVYVEYVHRLKNLPPPPARIPQRDAHGAVAADPVLCL